MTRKQNEIMALSAKLKPLTAKQTEYAIRKTFSGCAVKNYDKATCLDCGKRIKCGIDEEVVFCPHCQAKKKVFRSQFAKHCICYHQKICVVKGYQVIRTFALRADYSKANIEPTCSVQEVVQNWIDENGREIVVARPVKFMPRYIDDFNWWGNMEVRRVRYDWRGSRYSLHADSFAKGIKLIPKAIRNGCNGRFHGIAASEYIKRILSDNFFEYLIKTHQYEIAKEYVARDGYGFSDLKSELNICHRRGYVVKDARLWTDMVRSFRNAGVDTHNSKYICPKDLKSMHDYSVRLANRASEKRMIDKRRSEALEYEDAYRKAKKAYFGICFNDGEVFVSVIDSVFGILEEGTLMHHCVFSAGYYKKEESLILSARDSNGKRLETIEIDLSTYRIVQSRGLQNSTTDSHERIVNLVEKNMMLFKNAV